MNSDPTHYLIDALESCGFKYLVVVPASGLEAVFRHFETHAHCIYATREEEAVAIAAGLTVGGENAAVLMAQAGVGNALNAVFTLADAYDIYFPILVCFRGKQDPNLVQRVSARQTHLVLEALDTAEICWNEPSAKEAFRRFISDGRRWIMGSFEKIENENVVAH
jgi:sulfopyruvate decarboxylase TPP-binding subunit